MENYTYKIIEMGLNKIILRSDGACIPIELGNSDYQAYLKSLDETDSL